MEDEGERRSVPYFHDGVVEEVAAVEVEKEDAEQRRISRKMQVPFAPDAAATVSASGTEAEAEPLPEDKVSKSVDIAATPAPAAPVGSTSEDKQFYSFIISSRPLRGSSDAKNANKDDDGGSPSARLPQLGTPGKSPKPETTEKDVQTESSAPASASVSASRGVPASMSPLSARHKNANYSPSIEFESSAEKPSAEKQAKWAGVYKASATSAPSAGS